MKQEFWVLLGVAVSVGLFAYFGQIKIKDIEDCKLKTGWSADECRTQLSR